MLKEPIEEKYKELLRQRISLEGEIAKTKQESEAALKKADKRGRRYLLYLLLLPLLTLWCGKRTDPSVWMEKIKTQQDSIAALKAEIATMRQKEIRYIIRKGDRLSSLGALFFQDTTVGYRIGQENGLSTEFQFKHLVPGDTLNIRLYP
jgi:transposase